VFSIVAVGRKWGRWKYPSCAGTCTDICVCTHLYPFQLILSVSKNTITYRIHLAEMKFSLMYNIMKNWIKYLRMDLSFKCFAIIFHYNDHSHQRRHFLCHLSLIFPSFLPHFCHGMINISTLIIRALKWTSEYEFRVELFQREVDELYSLGCSLWLRLCFD